MEITERIIIEQLKRGNEEAYKHLYRHHYALLCHVAREYVGDDFLAEMLVAMSFFICGKCVRNSIFRFRYGVIWCVPCGITAWIIWPPRKNGRKWLFLPFRKKGKRVTCCRTITRWEVCWSMSWRKKFIRPFIIYRRSAGKFS